MATVDQAIPAKSGPSMIVQIAVLLVMTGAAIGIGWFSGSYLNGTVSHDAAAAESEPAKVDAHGVEAGGHGDAKGEHGEEKKAGNPLLLDLPPIMTSIAAPSDIWLRVELSVIFDESVSVPEARQAWKVRTPRWTAPRCRSDPNRASRGRREAAAGTTRRLSG